MSKDDVKLVLGGGDGCNNPKFLQCCHLGMIFLCESKVDDFRQLQFNLSFDETSDADCTISCKGVVVDSNFEEDYGMYKTYMIYTDIDENTKSRLKTISKEKQLRCPYCMNS